MNKRISCDHSDRLTWLGFAVAKQRGVHVDEKYHTAEVEVKVESFVERWRYVGGYYFGHGKSDSHDDQQLSVKSAKSRCQGVTVQQTEIVLERERSAFTCAHAFDISPPGKLDYFRPYLLSRLLSSTSSVPPGLRISSFIFRNAYLSRVYRKSNRRKFFFLRFMLLARSTEKTQAKWTLDRRKGNVEAPECNVGKRQWRYHRPQIHPPP